METSERASFIERAGADYTRASTERFLHLSSAADVSIDRTQVFLMMAGMTEDKQASYLEGISGVNVITAGQVQHLAASARGAGITVEDSQVYLGLAQIDPTQRAGVLAEAAQAYT